MTEQNLDRTKAEALVTSIVRIPSDEAFTPTIRAVSASDREDVWCP